MTTINTINAVKYFNANNQFYTDYINTFQHSINEYIKYEGRNATLIYDAGAYHFIIFENEDMSYNILLHYTGDPRYCTICCKLGDFFSIPSQKELLQIGKRHLEEIYRQDAENS